MTNQVRGQHVPPNVKAEALRRLQAGEVPKWVGDSLGINEKTIYRYAREARETAPVDPPAFTVPPLPSASMPLDELLDRRRSESQRVIEADAARSLIPVQVHTPGPIGLLIFGDPHIDNPGCDFVRLESHLQLAASRSRYLFAANVGDLQDAWPGRLQRLYAHSTTTAKDAWRLVEWMMRDVGVRWLFLIRGNHDCFVGDNDPLDWIMRGSGGVDERHSVRLSLKHPGGAETRIHSAHDFKGSSIYHDLHGLKRETVFGQRDHLIVAGHRHVGGDEGTVMPCGTVAQLVRVSGYKVVDDYARQGGFARKPIHPAALVIIDPDKPETARDRIWCAPSVEEGCEFLDWKRARYEGNARVRVSAGRGA